MHHRTLSACALACAAIGAPCAADVVTQWNTIALDAVRTTSTPPPRASRSMAMVHAAVFDAVNAIDGGYIPYHVALGAPKGASKEAAAVMAAHSVLTELFPALAGTFNAARDASLAGIADGQAKIDGMMVGASVGSSIVSWRATDGHDAVVPYTPGDQPGQWRPTPPGNAPGLLPQWGSVTPFGIKTGSQFQPDGPPDLASQAYADSLNQVKALGRIDSATRTQEQTEIALLWAAGAGTVTPPGMWNNIAQQVATGAGNTITENARLFAMLNVALADAAIAAWDCKYVDDFWRPLTAIHEADTDGNAQTSADPDWAPLIATPPFPAYVSGHSTFSAAAATILAAFFGTDAMSFDVTIDDQPGLMRSFDSFWAAAEEAGISRIYGGIHFDFDNFDGLMMGQGVGDYIFANHFAVVPAPAGGALAALALLVGVRRRR
ncbi:MAG: phosphatase PAP2 family protein [Phycisphaerales bacterium]|nr:MAG: phosphatase PAP2 family protein [Phycisphaerales bacterium]